MVQEKIEEHRRRGKALAFDLKELREVDQHGCDFLRELKRGGVELRQVPQTLSLSIRRSRRLAALPGRKPASREDRGENPDD